VPDSAGLLTENGNQIGAITVGGRAGLVIFIGLFAGLAAGLRRPILLRAAKPR